MSKDKWDEKPTDLKTVEALAWKILRNAEDEGLNPYPDAKRFTSGASGSDDDFWLDSIQGAGGTGYNASWDHMGTPYVVVRAAHIPYVVSRPGKMGKHYLDHLLVGITDDQGAGPAAGDLGDWTVDGDPKLKNLRKMGKFLIEELWSKDDFGNVRRIKTWHQLDNGTNYGYQTSGLYGGSPKLWKFRNLDRQIDASVRISLAAGAAPPARLRHLLVGYEGGGAW